MAIVKTAVSLPADVYHKAEKLRKQLNKSRSQFIAEALALMLQEAEQRARDEREIAAYKKHPETPADVASSQGATDEAWRPMSDDWSEEYHAPR